MVINKTRINIPIYNNYVDVYFTDDISKLIRKLFPEISEEEAELYDAGYFSRVRKGKKALPEFISIFDTGSITINALGHEVGHLTGQILNYHGVLYSPDNDEAFTYLLGFIQGKVYKKILRLKIKVKAE